jgi:hypothetical protein
VWTENTAEAFAKGELKGVGTSSKDDLRLVPTLKSVAGIDDPYIFCVVADGYGATFAGTGNDGRIYRVAGGKAELLYTTPEIAVLSMAIDRDGNLIAGTAPNGKVFAVGKDGRGRLLFDADEPNVTALCVASDGIIYAGVSTPAKVYRIGADGKAEVAFAPEAMYVTTLAPGANGSVLVGLGQPGCVYRIDGSTATPVYDSGAGCISAVAEANGAVYAAGDPQPKIEKISDRTITTIVKKAKGTVRAMATDARGNVYAAAGGVILRIDAQDTVANLDSPEEADLFCLSVAANGDIAAGTFTPAQVLTGSVSSPLTGSFESAVHEVGAGARQGRLTWLADTPEGGSAAVYTRSGDVSEPDGSWNGWIGPYGNGDAVAGPPGRYMQYKVELTGGPESAPTLKQVSMTYLTRNQPPTVTVTAPRPGEDLSGDYSIRWKANDPDKDKLEYTIYYSSDQGKTWTKIAEEIAGKKTPAEGEGGEGAPQGEESAPQGEQPTAKSPAMTGEEISSMLAEMESQMREMGIPESEISSAMADARDTMEEQDTEATAEPVTSAEAEGPEAAGPQPTSITWKTTALADGAYLVKAVASDRIANGSGFEQAEAVVGPVTVCNQKPAIALPTSGISVGADGVVTAAGSVLQKLVRVTSVEWRVDGGAWRAAAAEDGLFDSDAENYTVVTDPLAKGKHKIEVRAFNSAGLMSTEQRDVTVG